jgi:hypothetical protein
VLPDDIEDCARDGLRLLRRRRQLDRRHRAAVANIAD